MNVATIQFNLYQKNLTLISIDQRLQKRDLGYLTDFKVPVLVPPQ